MTIHIACAAEGQYIKHSATMILSALENAGGHEVEIHYLHGAGVRSSARSKLSRMVEENGGAIRFYEILDASLMGLPTRGFTRKATWYRAFLPQLARDVDRILYLDSDLIVVDSLEPLWGVPLGQHVVGAVTNIFPPDWIGRAHQLKISPKRYFNAGVLLLSLDAMRRHESTEKIISYGTAHADELALRDQDALNVVLGDARLDLHPRWNCMNSILSFPVAESVFGRTAVAEARARPGIRHFEGPGPNKPWHLLGDPATRELYAGYRRRTPWPRFRLEGVTPRNVARHLRGQAFKP